MTDILEPKTEFKNFFILLSRDKWFNSVADYHQLDKVLETCHKSSEENWRYNLSKLEFKNICLKRHVRPSFVSGLANDGSGIAKLILSMTCECVHESDSKKLKDPILSLGAKLVVQFEYIPEEAGDTKVIQSSWHLDRHDASRTVSSLHPLYHYEFGGTEITKDTEFNYGDFILLDTPRIMHPPLDIVLAIDFVIKNFYRYDQHKTLTEQGIYKKYVKNAQLRLWRPYIISFASHYHDFGGAYEIDSVFATNILECISTVK